MILIKNANLISMEEINYEICDILYGSDPSNGPIAL